MTANVQVCYVVWAMRVIVLATLINWALGQFTSL
jgi:hypothetical protein